VQEADISIFLMSMGLHFFGEPFILIYLVDALRSFDLTRNRN